MEVLLLAAIAIFVIALVTRNPYSSVKYYNGQHAEYLTYESLRHFENDGGKFLFNIFIPKRNGETTEIDVLLICSKGLFVFECKDYSGWIFGNEAQKNWTQTLPKGRGRCHKEYFYNPIMQNASHIRHLKNFIGKNIPMRSIIVFSDRCVLKNIIIKSKDISVINHYDLESVIAEICSQTPAGMYSETEINDIYSKLYPYTRLDDEAKEKHIENIRKNFNLHKVNFDSSNLSVRFANWQQVTHRQFGNGVVLQQKNQTLQIKFARAGVKWVHASYVSFKGASY